MREKRRKSLTSLIVLLLTALLITGCAHAPSTGQTSTDSGQKTGSPAAKQEDSSSNDVKTTPSRDQTSAVKGMPATVTYVVDGDTLDVKFKNGKTERIRMLLIDTPETKHPRLGVQPFGPESSKFTKTQLTGKKVGVELDVSERDKYGRLLAYIWIGKQNFNQLLLEKGLARVAYVYPPNTKYVDQFRATQEKAQKAGVGIWSIENYAQQDGFHANSKASTANRTVSGGTSPASKQNNQVKTPEKPKGSCNIKGNQSGIYHMPGGQYYDRTKAEVMFCSEAEAQKAGYRKSQR
ncbi:thermonuclease family protein [Fictibacillus sp. KU28468]|uniref:thermonuclease family protein n=1 Tax=Fictibacillus sp. KU28468 TaxID=2991053 RepID=UPI00223DAB6B|nr:thermonuclease family protein [Fictibacillus sp. KU28468]UZJ79625.1 thermonuclease family protein [Fictibacillus sp. KU28468]